MDVQTIIRTVDPLSKTCYEVQIHQGMLTVYYDGSLVHRAPATRDELLPIRLADNSTDLVIAVSNLVP